MTNRRRARELALQILYQIDMTSSDPKEGAETFLKEVKASPAVKDFTKELVLGVWESREEIDHLIERTSQHWKLMRMAVVDRNILRLAAYQLLHMKDIPVKVAIDEAIELGKRFGSEESGAFINGVLDKIREGLEGGCPMDLEAYLPRRELWPERIFTLSQLILKEKINVSTALIDENLKRGLKDKPAIYYQDQVITYGQIGEQVNRLANSLKGLGIKQGDRVMLRFPNCPELIISWLAVTRMGAISVSTMPLLRARELSYIANDAEARVVIVASPLLEEIEKARPNFQTVKEIVVAGEPVKGYTPFQRLLQEGAPEFTPADTRRDDVAIIAYTSGTTGVPKGAAHFHEDLINITETYGRPIIQPREDDIFGGHPTLAFTFGMGGLMIIPLRFGAATALLPSFTPEGLLELIERYRVTVLFGTPTSYRMVLQVRDRKYDLSSLRFCVSAGEPLPPAIYYEWKERYGVELVEHIGSTEMFYCFLSARPGQVKPGSCGQPVPGYQVKVVDDDLNELPPGTPGHLAVKGPTGCRYWRKPERQREYVRNGWNLPGDIFMMDEEGYFFYQCRADDLIISGGYNIAGIEVEQALMEHPAVLESAVVGSPDPLRGQKVKAFVVLKEGFEPTEELARELQDFVKNTLAPFKYPREIEFLPSLPKTETGKIRRVELREREYRRFTERGAGEETM